MKINHIIRRKLRPYAAGFRVWVNKSTKRYPVICGAIENGIGFLFATISSFCSALTNNPWIYVPTIFAAMTLLYAFQRAKLTNRRIKEVDEALIQGIEEGERLRKESRNVERKETNVALDWLSKRTETLSETIDICHAVSHRAKYVACNFKTQDSKSANKDLADMCIAILNSLEEVLTHHYGKTVSASIKMVSGKDSLITAARGKNNIKSRGGQLSTAVYNKREVRYSDNYAYKSLIDDGAKFFSESNLIEFTSKKEADDVFYCEYQDWSDIFISTIVVPIRTFYDIDNNDYAGMICVDCKEAIPEWDSSEVERELAYGMIATIADSLYLPFVGFRNIGGQK